MLITEAYYRSITSDYSTAASAVSSNIDEAQALIEDNLKRQLDHGTYTEVLELWGTTVYPSVTPLITSTDGDIHPQAAAIDVSDTGNASSFGGKSYCPTTYVGGYTVDTLPAKLKIAIAKTARGLALGGSQRSSGIVLAQVGDTRVEYSSNSSDPLDMIAPGVSQLIKPYKRRTMSKTPSQGAD